MRPARPGWFDRRTAQLAGDGWVGLRARQIFILPTGAGLAFGVLLGVLLLGAINYDNNLVFGLTFLLAGLGFVTMLHTYRNLAGVEFRSGRGRPGFAGERIGFQLWLRSADGRPRQAIELRNADGERATTTAAGPATAVWLQRHAPRRGRLPLGRVTVSTGFPLGLFRAWSYLDVAHAEPVYPAPAAPGRPPAVPCTGGTGEGGGHDQGPDDFRGLRAYRHGDSLGQVDWKAWARGRGLLTRQFAGAAPPEEWLDFTATGESDTEARLARLCRWVLDAEQAQRRYGLRLPDRTIGPGRGSAHRDRCLLALADHGLGT